MSNHKSVLIIASSGGGGLLQAANAKEQELKRNNPSVKVIKVDVYKDWGWKAFGRFCIWMWDTSQKQGRVKALTWFIRLQKYAEYIFGAQIFYNVLRCLMKEEIDRVLDTQVMGTWPILKAIRIYNRLRKKNVILEKVFVDLPTKRATHYFQPIKKLSPLDKKYLRIVTVPPLLEGLTSSAEYWEKYFHVKESEVVRYEDFYIREGFHPYRKKERSKEFFPIRIRYKNEEEHLLMQNTYEMGPIKGVSDKEGVTFTFGPKDKVFTILLGSQPAFDATYEYVKKVIQTLYHQGRKDTPYALFVFCSDHSPGEESLFKRVCHYVQTCGEYHPSLSVIPMSFQKEDVVASLFFRSDATITRSGGQTSMELMSISKGLALIHSEAKEQEDILKGIPGWEAGNACYLQDKIGAKIITPQSCEIISSVF